MAKNVRWKYEPYAFYNKAGIEERLSVMAAQGWFIEKIGFFWKYRKGQPVKRTYNVVYMEDPDSEVKEQKQLEFVEYCEAAGWELVCVKKDMLIFCHDGENPVPIETDVEMELESIDKVMRSSYMQYYVGMIFYIIMWVKQLYDDFTQKPFQAICNSFNLLLLACVLAAILIAVEGILYVCWMKKAERYAEEENRILPVSNQIIYRNVVDWTRAILFVLLSIELIFSGEMYGLVAFLLGILLLIHMHTAKKEKRHFMLLKYKATDYKSRHWDTLLVVILVLGMMYTGLFLGSAELMRNVERDIARAPVSLVDIMEIKPELTQFTDYYDEESMVAKYIYFDHDVHNNDNWNSLRYEVGIVKQDKLYNWEKDAFFKQEEILLEEYDKLNSSFYSADEAYRKVDKEADFQRVEYVFIWGDSFATVRFDNKLTDEQVKIVAEKLGNIE